MFYNGIGAGQITGLLTPARSTKTVCVTEICIVDTDWIVKNSYCQHQLQLETCTIGQQPLIRHKLHLPNWFSDILKLIALQQGQSLLTNFGGTNLIVCVSMTSPCSFNHSTTFLQNWPNWGHILELIPGYAHRGGMPTRSRIPVYNGAISRYVALANLVSFDK